MGTPDPSSAISSVYSETGAAAMEREGSMNGLLPDLAQLSLEKGRPLDVEDLDDEGWRAASEQKKLLELGSLGEGAGGAVTKCMLQDGKTVFALKVILSLLYVFYRLPGIPRLLLHRQTQTSRSKYCGSLISTKTAHQNTYVNTMEHSWIGRQAQFRLLWNSVKAAVSTASTEKSKSLVVGLEKKCWVR